LPMIIILFTLTILSKLLLLSPSTREKRTFSRLFIQCLSADAVELLQKSAGYSPVLSHPEVSF
jgi:hypothetical protein